MALMPSYFTTTKMSGRSSPKKKTTARARQLQAEIDKLVAANTSKKKLKSETPLHKAVPFHVGNIPTGVAVRQEPNVYTGDNLIGIAVMHKSCMVPVFRKQDLEDIGRMRR